MTIKVTQKHIDEGKKSDCRNCPVALAIAEATMQDWEVTFNKTWPTDGNYSVLSLPDLAVNFIFRYDMNEVCQPFEFELEI